MILKIDLFHITVLIFIYASNLFFLNCPYQSKSYFLKNDNVSDYSGKFMYFTISQYMTKRKYRKEVVTRILFLIVKTIHPHIPGENSLTK